jgi:hypothetical protein
VTDKKSPRSLSSFAGTEMIDASVIDLQDGWNRPDDHIRITATRVGQQNPLVG